MEDQELISKYGLSADQWEACEKSAAQITEKISPALAKSMKDHAGQIFEEIYNYIAGELESDTAYNFKEMVRSRTEQIVTGLLNGGWQEEQVKPWLEGYDLDAFRLNVYKAHRETIQNKLIEGLLEENNRLKERLEIQLRYR